MTVQIGKKVPDFELPSSSGENFRLKDLKGGTVVLYFYPKDSTPGCTNEGRDFNRLLPQFKKLNARIFGLSRDSLKAHAKFIEKEGFRFELLSDAEEKAARLFDVIKLKKLYGREYMGIERSTFVIGPDQKLVAEFRNVKVPGHAEAVLQSLRELNI